MIPWRSSVTLPVETTWNATQTVQKALPLGPSLTERCDDATGRCAIGATHITDFYAYLETSDPAGGRRLLVVSRISPRALPS